MGIAAIADRPAPVFSGIRRLPMSDSWSGVDDATREPRDPDAFAAAIAKDGDTDPCGADGVAALGAGDAIAVRDIAEMANFIADLRQKSI